MSTSTRRLLPLLLAGVLSACAGFEPDAPTGADDVDVKTADIRSFEIRRTSGFAGSGFGGPCRERGVWHVDLTARTIRGSGCIDRAPVEVDRSLSNDERIRLRRAVARLERAERPSVCPADAGSTAVDVVRAKRTERYVGERMSCRSDAIPLTSGSINALYDAVAAVVGEEAPEE